MVLLCIATAIIAFLIIFALTAKINIFCEYKKHPGEKIYTDFKVSLGGINITKLLSKINVKKAEVTTEKEQKKLVDKLNSYAKTLSVLKKIYSKNRWYIRKRIYAERINFHLKFGLNNAATTGIATGAIWSVLYGILALLGQIGTVKEHYFEVVPVFTEAGFISEGNVKVSFRMISILSVGLRLYLTYKNIQKEN